MKTSHYYPLNKLSESYLNSLKKIIKKKEKNSFFQIHQKILSSNLSTKERLDSYPALYQEIFQIVGKVKKIIDLGCGLNPISLPWFPFKDIFYFAYDFNKEEIGFLNKYFKLIKKVYPGFRGRAFFFDLLDFGSYPELPKADLCFLFKTLDLEKKGLRKNFVEGVISQIKAKWLIVSFPLVKVSGRRMNQPRRRWFESVLKKLKLEFRIIKKRNEVFYLIKK